MKYLALTAASFLLVACNNSDSGDGVAVTRVDQATGDSALAALYLANSGDGIVTWDDRSFDDGVYTFTDVVFTDLDSGDDADADEEGEGGEADIDFDEVHAARMTVAGPRFDENGDVIFDRLSIEEGRFVSSEDDAGDGGFASFIVESPNAELVADIARGFSGEDGDDEDTDSSAYRFGLIALNELIAEGTDGDTAEDYRFAMNRFALDGYDGDTLQRFELMGLEIDGSSPDTGPVRIRLAELSMDEIGQAFFAPFTEGMRQAMADAAGDDAAPSDMPEYDPMDAYGAFTMRGLDVNVGGILVTLDRMTGEILENGDTVVGTTEMTPLVIRPDTEYPLGAQMSLGLGMLGYQQLEFTAAGESVYDRGDDRVYTRGDNYFEMTDGFRVESEMDMSGYLEYARAAMRLSMQDQDDFDMEGLFDPLMINRFVLRIEDMSLLDRALTAGSAAQGMSKAELRQQAAAMITLGMLGAPAEIPRPLLTELSEALVGFINEGGTITIAMDPDEPVSVGTLMEQAEAEALDFGALGLTITSEPAED